MKSKLKPTPGPWFVTKTREDIFVDPIGVKMLFPNKKGMANAHLIAAAPALYTACVAFQQSLTQQEIYDAMQLVNAAIAQAEGHTK